MNTANYRCYTTLSGVPVRCRDALGSIERVVEQAGRAGRVPGESLRLLRDLLNSGGKGAELVRDTFIRQYDNLLDALRYNRVNEARIAIHSLLNAGSMLHDELPEILARIHGILLAVKGIPRGEFHMQLAQISDSIISTYCALDHELEKSKWRVRDLALQTGLSDEEVGLIDLSFRLAQSFVRTVACGLSSALPLIS